MLNWSIFTILKDFFSVIFLTLSTTAKIWGNSCHLKNYNSNNNNKQLHTSDCQNHKPHLRYIKTLELFVSQSYTENNQQSLSQQYFSATNPLRVLRVKMIHSFLIWSDDTYSKEYATATWPLSWLNYSSWCLSHLDPLQTDWYMSPWRTQK